MGESTSREQFELCFPVQAGVVWSDALNTYIVAPVAGLTPTNALVAKRLAYAHDWSVWQASRQAVIVELPAIRPEPVLTGEALKADGEAATWSMWAGEKLAKEDCRAAIEAQGLRVGVKS